MCAAVFVTTTVETVKLPCVERMSPEWSDTPLMSTIMQEWKGALERQHMSRELCVCV